MILDVADLVARHCGHSAEAARAMQVAFVKTTDPVFLLFAPHQEHPLYVVRVGDIDVLSRRLELKARLHRLLPDVVARPMGVFPIKERDALYVQEGLQGHPWYRISDRLRSDADWMTLRQRCIDQLRVFRTAVESQPDWVVSPVNYGATLLTLAAGLRDVLTPLGAGVAGMLAEAAATLEAMGLVSGAWQHGDFTLNNLLVDDHRVRVVDLADFGRWHVPLVDSFSLGCSLHFHASRHCDWHPLADDLASCANATAPDTYTSRQKTAFFAHFLLTAISDTERLPSRTTIRSIYLDQLRQLADDTPRFVRAFETQR